MTIYPTPGNPNVYATTSDGWLVGDPGYNYIGLPANYNTILNTVTYQLATGPVIASLANPSINTGDAAGDTYTDIDSLVGSPDGGALYGDNSGLAEQLWALGGVTSLYAGSGYTTFITGAQPVYMFGQTSGGHNLADYEVATSGVTVSLLNPLMNTGWAAGDTYSNVHDIAGSSYGGNTLIADNYGDNLIGNDDDNILIGGTGNDTLNGGVGGSTLTGGLGSNWFVFGGVMQGPGDVPMDPLQVLTNAANGIYSTITDFDQGNGAAYNVNQSDSIDVSKLVASLNDGGLTVGSLVKVVEDSSGSFAWLQFNGPSGWVNLAQMSGLKAGEAVSVILNESNAPQLITVQQGAPALGDLIASNFNYAGFNSTLGDPTFAFAIENIGSGTVAASSTGIYYSGSNGSLGTLFATSNTGSLNSSSTINQTTSPSLPSNLFGTYYFSVEANYNQAITETNYANDQSNSIALVLDTRTSAATGTLTGTSSNDIILGLNPNGDIINGEGGSDILVGGGGNDTFQVWSDGPGTNNKITGGGGTNTLDYSQAPGAVTVNLQTGVTSNSFGGTDNFSGIENVVGSQHNDTIITAISGGDTLFGGSGNTTFDVSGGTNYIQGGTGFNTLSFAAVPGPVNVSLVTDITSDYYGGHDYFSNIQQVDGSAFNDFLVAGSATAVLNGEAGNNTLVGGSGNGTFELWSHGSGTDYSDYIQGGIGTNTLDYSQSPGSVNVNMATGTTSNYYGGNDYFAGIQDVVGTAFNDTLQAGLSAAVLNGGAGNNTMLGGAGNDTFDLWSHSPGTSYNNYIDGGGGANTLDYSQSPGPVNVSLVTGITSDYYGGHDYFSNIQQVDGSAFNDFLVAGSATAVLNGEAGNNTLVGGSGNDTFELWSHGSGTDYSDYIQGGIGANTLDYSQSPGSINVNMATGNTSNYYGGNDYFGGIQDVVGTAFNDTLQAGLSAAVLNGGAGNNTMLGGAGNDTFDLWSHSPGTSYNNYIDGGGGANTLDYSQSPGPVTADLISGQTSNYYGGFDYFSHIQEVIGSAFNDTLIANGAGTVLVGGSGHDTFEFVEGNTNGATVTNFVSGTDQLEFNGFGTVGAAFVQDNATQWTVTSSNGADHETITFSNAATIHASDFHFV